ncbi:MAG TPA: sigma-70 family RNA polymerase sigma factor [Candidatus Angelobacter sp.]|nr:sigma-70 family RNA polymerase sigma factor [Candidatus Angelobacter sp.]
MESQGDAFPATRYSVISAARSENPAERSQAIETITIFYWKPVYKYVRLRWNLHIEDARDFTQDFFLRLIEKDFLGSYDPAKGRLRTFLRTCVDRMFLNQSRDSHRLKRGGVLAQQALDFDEAELELAKGARELGSPEDYFEKEWVRSMFAQAVEQLRAECESKGKNLHFEVFAGYDLDDSDPRPSYANLAARFNLSVMDITNYLAYARREFRRCVMEKLRVMTGSEEEFRREAQSLLGVPPK